MKKRFWVKKVIVSFFLMLCLTMFTNNVRGETNSKEFILENDGIRVAGIISDAKNFIQSDSEIDFTDNEALVEIGQILVAVGASALLITGAIIAAQWAAATPDKKAKLKGQLIGWAVSAAVIFGAVTIWETVKTIGEQVANSL